MKKRTKTQHTSPPRGALSYQKSLVDLSHEETLVWLQNVRERLELKMQRERAYLDRRAARGTHTPTDDVYEADQVLEAELLAILDELARGFTKEA
jgi:hypothetical protein